MIVKNIKYIVIGLGFLALQACGPAIPTEIEQAMTQLPEKLDYNIHVKPILSDRCFACHGNDKANQKANLRLDVAENAYAELSESPGKYAIVPENLGKSEVFHRLISKDPEIVMPTPESNLVLTDYEKAVLIKWIDEGAEYKPHWSFIKPEKATPPTVEKSDWIKNPIDNFVLKTLENKNWQPAEKADKETLLRRVTFDLTGLPPTLEEIDGFLADNSPDAYEKVVDRLLASPHYGERMAADWMDLARYADTHGYTVDRYRDMSPWRDWVIEAFNQNMAYDDFVTWQIAGDLLPNPTKKQILATGFNRNHQQNMEGGIVAEEFRVEYVADRTNTLGIAFLGLTMECARCHDHKYDPISQKEYFQLYSFFNNVKEAGQISWNDAMPVPTMLLTDEEQDKTLAFINQKIDEQEQAMKQLKAQVSTDFEQWLAYGRLRTKTNSAYPQGIQAHFKMEQKSLRNSLRPSQKGVMKQQFATTIPLNLVDGKTGKGLALDGDAWLDLGQVGRFGRTEPFSVSVWVNLPKDLKNGVIFHKGDGAALFNFRGYHLALVDDRLEILMAHNKPYNAIIQYADNIPKDQWIQLTMTYDGSSKASGLKVYLNGAKLSTEIDQDHLYKDILFDREKEPGLQFGARWRGAGIRGAVIDDILVFDRQLTAPEVLQLADKNQIKNLFTKPVADLTTAEKAGLKDYYVTLRRPAFNKIARQLQKERIQLNETTKDIQEVMVMQEMEKPRPSFILERGAYDAHGEQVYPATPKSVLPLDEDLPKNRLGLAQWLMDEQNPLTARVAINRIWQQFFGQGLVTTTDDFGFQGALPSHPELLDWLAVDFQASDWDVKNAVKQMVLSATYQQSSKNSPEIMEADKANIFLARGPSARLTAEMIRDNALAATDLLVKKIGGKSVKPYQPVGLWKVNGGKYVSDEGDKLYRRSLYTFWKRSVPNPTQATFDAPTRSLCTVKRQKTSTPLQALIMLNDPTFTEAAKVMGEQISTVENPAVGISNAFKKFTGRAPNDGELKVLLELQQAEYKKFKQQPEKAKGWLSVGAYKLIKNIEPARVAANTIVASTILNADATIVKR
ncbi:MAG: DUF1553 domain-containing protein [Bacteroidota bacterium]